ncbi:hypothetical protein HPP92_019212, partial [Vanilla planifolia]
MRFFDDLPPMDFLRSERMSFVQLIIPVECAHRAVSYLGEIGLVQFKDLNDDKSPFQRTFVNQVKRCGEMSRKLRFLSDQINKANLAVSAHSALQSDIDLEDLEVQLGEHEAELLEMNTNSEKLQQTYNELLEFKLVLMKAGGFLVSPQNHAVPLEREMDENVHANEDGEAVAFLEQVEKTVFVVFFSGEQARTKILKICNSVGANCYPVPEDMTRRRQVTREVSTRLAELETTLDAGIRHRKNVLSSIGCQVWQWTMMGPDAFFNGAKVLTEDALCCFPGWCPAFAKPQIKDALQRATFDSNSQVGIIFHVMDSVDSPPTYFRTNRFTHAFQEIVDAYGVARYQEANPAVYSVVTFPFLFAVMFGDWGHGICLLLAALFLILRERKLGSQKLGSFMEMAFGGRYVILLMAFFSIYCGLIYNEFFSVPYHIFGSSAYKCGDSACRDAHTTGLIKYREPYKFGVDPSWRGSRSELPFLNSLKMKMSILLGVAQMNLGIILSYFDAKFHGNALDVRYQFVPQMIFLNSLFGYLALLIIVKWCTGSQADLYHVMIYMFLSPMEDLGANQLFWGQKVLQILLLLMALVAVPWMLFPKPFILRKLHIE